MATRAAGAGWGCRGLMRGLIPGNAEVPLVFPAHEP